MTLASGTRLGPYEILAPIGAGGMGEIYRARDTRLDHTVAILFPSRRHLGSEPPALETFQLPTGRRTWASRTLQRRSHE